MDMVWIGVLDLTHSSLPSVGMQAVALAVGFLGGLQDGGAWHDVDVRVSLIDEVDEDLEPAQVRFNFADHPALLLPLSVALTWMPRPSRPGP
jgi:hypothetical protein